MSTQSEQSKSKEKSRNSYFELDGDESNYGCGRKYHPNDRIKVYQRFWILLIYSDLANEVTLHHGPEKNTNADN